MILQGCLRQVIRSEECPGRRGSAQRQGFTLLEGNNIALLRVLTDRGTEYCGAREHHEYQLYLALEDIDHSRTKARHPQTNGICERFHKRSRTSSTLQLPERPCTLRWSSCRRTWIVGWNTIATCPTPANTVSAKHLCRRSWIRGSSLGIRFWIRRRRQLPSLVDLVCQIKFWLLQIIANGIVIVSIVF